MNDVVRGTSTIEYPEGKSGPDAASTGNVLLVLPINGHTAPRTRNELEKALQEKQVNSLRDICRAFDVRIEGNYVGTDGEPVHASIPVEDETTFTPNGMTEADPALFELYVKARCYEQLAEYLQRNNRDSLSASEVADLEARIKEIEGTLEGE